MTSKEPGKALKAANRKHEITVKLIEAVKENSDILDWLVILGGTLGGVALTAITAFFAGDTIPKENPYRSEAGDLDLQKLLLDAISSAAISPIFAALKASEKSGNSTTLMGFVATLSMQGIVGIAVAHLMVKAMFSGGGGQAEGGGTAGLFKLLGVAGI